MPTSLTRRQMLLDTGTFAAGTFCLGGMALAASESSPIKEPRLRTASVRFGITAESGGPTGSKVGAVVGKVYGPLKTTVTLLENGRLRLCLVATDFGAINALNVSDFYRRTIADELKLPVSNVLLFINTGRTSAVTARRSGL